MDNLHSGKPPGRVCFSLADSRLSPRGCALTILFLRLLIIATLYQALVRALCWGHNTTLQL